LQNYEQIKEEVNEDRPKVPNFRVRFTNVFDTDPLFVEEGYWEDYGTPGDESDDVFIPGNYRLLPGSPCIDAGWEKPYGGDYNLNTEIEETLSDHDLDGNPRILDGDGDGTATVDIGAYEYLRGDVNYDGKVTVLDLIAVRKNLFRDAASSPAARRCDVNDDGTVNVLDLLAVRRALAEGAGY
jgi:hypothetical protein